MHKQRFLPPREAREGIDYLSKLSLDVATVLWSFLLSSWNLNTTLPLLSVCKAFRKQLAQPVLWKKVCVRINSNNVPSVDCLSQMPIQEISISPGKHNLNDIVSALPFLRKIHTRDLCVTGNPVAWPRSLERITLWGYDVDNFISLKGSPLKELNLYACTPVDDAVPVLVSLPLETLRISGAIFRNDDGIGSVLEGLAPTLTNLDIVCKPGVVNNVMRAVERLPNLKRLCLQSDVLSTQALTYLPIQVSSGRLSPKRLCAVGGP